MSVLLIVGPKCTLAT